LETFDIGRQIHDAQAAFFIDLVSFMADYARIDHDHGLLSMLKFTHIDNNQLDGFADLGRGKPDTGGIIHGLGHVLDQFFKACIEISYRFCLLTKDGIRKF